MKDLAIKHRVIKYGSTLLVTKCISFLFTLFIVRSLPIEDIGTYFYLIGIASVLEIVITWGTPVSIQTKAGKIANTNIALSAVFLGLAAFSIFLVLFFLSKSIYSNSVSLSFLFLLFISSTSLGNTISTIALAYDRSILEGKNDIILLLSREGIRFLVLAIVNYAFNLSIDNLLFILTGVNLLIFTVVLVYLLKNSDLRGLRPKEDLSFLTKHGAMIMLTFIVYSFPFVFIRIFGYTYFGKEASGLLNICLLTSAVFQLYANSWGMAVKPILGKLNNEQNTVSISKIEREIYWLYLGGCVLMYMAGMLFFRPIFELFKLDQTSSLVYSLYCIVLLYNLIFGIGSINNSFLQMLKLTRIELKGMSLSLLFYPLIVLLCVGSTIQTLAWAIVLLELFKLTVQEYVLYKNSNQYFAMKVLSKAAVIGTAAIVTCLYF